MRRAAIVFVIVCSARPVAERPATSASLFTKTFTVAARSEVLATIEAGCARCDWGAAGREAAVLMLLVDGTYSQHLILARGDAPADYQVALGTLEAGRHALAIDRDPEWIAPAAGPPAVSRVDIRSIRSGDADFDALSRAPILFARANTVGRFTDLPILMWYEVVPTPRGRQLRYSVIFTNEDGGTATDRLMATWGRTTDIELVYGVEVDDRGAVLGEQFQGPGHAVPDFHGRHEARHPLLWVATDNNMVDERGTTRARFAPAAERFDLRDRSREAVMDAHPWTYALAAKEMVREGKIDDDAAPGSGRIADPRRFVFVEGCSELQNAGLVFSVRARDAGGGERWFDSDRAQAAFRIVRTGCFQGAVPVPAGAKPTAVRFRAFPSTAASAPATQASVRVTRINRVFTLGDDYLPRPSIFEWTGSLPLAIGGDWREVIF